MVEIQIGAVRRELSKVHESWINQQINRRREEGAPICVKIFIQENGIHMTLSTRDCPKASGGRPPSPIEKRIFDLWEKRGLNKDDYHGGNLIAFLKQFKSYI